VKSTISDLGFSDYSEWFIGHSGSTYYRKKDSEKAEIFRKVEPYLIFLDVSALEAGHAETTSKLEAIEEDRRDMRQQIRELRELVYKMQREKYDKGEIVMDRPAQIMPTAKHKA
jgi:hypothetical protein